VRNLSETFGDISKFAYYRCTQTVSFMDFHYGLRSYWTIILSFSLKRLFSRTPNRTFINLQFWYDFTDFKLASRCAPRLKNHAKTGSSRDLTDTARNNSFLDDSWDLRTAKFTDSWKKLTEIITDSSGIAEDWTEKWDSNTTPITLEFQTAYSK